MIHLDKKVTLILVLFSGFPFISEAQLLSEEELDTVPVYTDLEKAIEADEKVLKLRLNREWLKKVPEGIWHLKDLQVLDLSRNRIDSIPDSLSQLTYLQELYLNRNRIEYISPDAFDLKDLQVLELARNEVDTLPGRMKYLEELRQLDVSKNELKHLGPGICGLKNLQVLNANKNYIQKVPECIVNLGRLRRLDLWSNEFGRIPEQMKQMSSLEWVDLRGILMSDEEQRAIRQNLPEGVELHMSQPCDCDW